VIRLGVLRLAFKNLTRRRTRTALTIFGVVIAISFTVGLLSVSEGFMASLENTIRKRGGDIYVWTKRMTMFPLPGSAFLTFPQEYVDNISRYENVKVAIPIFETIIPTSQPEKFPIIVDGLPPSMFQFLKPYASVEKGRMLNDRDNYTLLLGNTLAKSENLDVGSKLAIMGKNFTVVGILNHLGDIDDNIAFAPLSSLQEAYHQAGYVNYAVIIVEDINAASETASKIGNDFPDLSAFTLEEALAQMKELLQVARAIHLSVSSVSLLIGILFVLCTMIMAVSERVREIGTMRAIGASRFYIFKLIVAESVIISLVGGLFGCLGGYGLSKVINWTLNAFVGIAFIEPLVSIRLVAAGLAVAFLVGCLAGLYPAWRASKQNIVEALRYE
jgi:putative ABC transport system permease protein